SGNAASGGFSKGRKSSEIFAATVLNSNRAVQWPGNRVGRPSGGDKMLDKTEHGVTVGSLQVTCSRLGISLRRIIFSSCSERRTADVRLGSVGIAHVRKQKEVSQPEAYAAPVAKFAITMRHRGKAQTTDIPLSSAAIETLALEAMPRDLDIAGLIGQVLVAAINKDMIHKILGD